MPQNISGNPVLSPSSLALSQVELRREPVEVDTFADRLMDDLFDDVERLLEGSVPLPEPVKVEIPKLQATPLSFQVAPTPKANLVPRPSLPQWKTQEELPEVRKLAKRKPAKARGAVFQKMLIFGFCTSVLAALSFWVGRSLFQRFSVAAQPAPAVATATTATPVDADAQFSQYMQRSLTAIDRRKTTGQPMPAAPYNSSLPSVAVNKDVAKSDTTLPRSPVVINVPSVPSAPVSAAVSPAATTELNQILTRLSSVLERLSPVLNRPAVTASAPQVAPVARPSAAPEPQRSLRGIAIASDPSQSAVLFEMNGVTQRYYIGESIGSSGWSVVDISNNYVSVRRNGEVRSIAVGQKL